MPDRRTFLGASSAALMTALVRSGAAFAAAPGEARLVTIVLRGGLDGLHALAPFADPDYQKLRPRLALGGARLDVTPLSLDGYFGLHPALAPLEKLYREKELLIVPAAATAYRQRSHFDGQNMLENGSGAPYGARDGWLNRALLGLNDFDRRLGLALGPAVPLILQGDAPVQAWSDSKSPEVDADFLLRLQQVYASDPLFLDALHDAQGALKPDLDKAMLDGTRGAAKETRLAAHAAGDLLARAEGPRVAVLEIQGWDTHFGQEPRLRNLLAQVADAITTLKGEMQAVWSKTAVLVVSEFGRTAAENASQGTDHGTGGIAMLAGGAVNGGIIHGAWPGLSQKALYEGRDLRAVNAYESLFKAVMIGHLGLDQGFVEDRVLPGSAAHLPADGLLR
ncbi:MAG: DUF1501 domain-containing protein [Rhodobacteraceae bacterium]|nr:DUF1501 domain-containing protein [Paracoccaceae bacterium]